MRQYSAFPSPKEFVTISFDFSSPIDSICENYSIKTKQYLVDKLLHVVAVMKYNIN